ncbi:MAG: hypothetical protein PHX80_01005 [Candidatus Nanoarchaeia archaeon]|nr:hypothetical protein [Candidatus Nanoarchaeia archaeon]MDD5588632.1 hypothetical protein [Candidatus Nanoarchaeia archaeon]
MGKQVKNVLNLVAWATGILVSLAVGFGMTGGTLTVTYVPLVVTQVAGWVVVITTIVSAVMAVLKQ